MSDPDNINTPIAFDEFLHDAVREILRHEDAPQFLDWCRGYLPRYLIRTSDVEIPHPASEDWPAFALSIGRGIWNAMPLPGNHYRPRPLPAPGRNDPCPCGSGRKHKRCCIGLDADMPLDSRALWPYLARQLKQKELRELAASGAAPVESLVDAALQCHETRQSKRGVALLEPLFNRIIRKPDALYDEALSVLCDLYDDLGFHNKKHKLLQWVIDTQPASALRAGAWQRLATIRMDQNDHDAAWAAFERARRDEPDALSLGLLEVQLLYADNRGEAARQQAASWLERLQQLGFDPQDMPARFFVMASRDPAAAIGRITLDAGSGFGIGLIDWLASQAERPLPSYSVTQTPVASGPADDTSGENLALPPDLLARLRSMGISPDSVTQALQDAVPADTAAAAEDTSDATPAEADSGFLQPPDLTDVETEWRDVFPLDKPFSVQDIPFDGTELVWQPFIEEAWMDVLEMHPEALDSLNIIDDLATALHLHPDFGLRWLDDCLLLPLLERARAMIDRAFTGTTEPRLLWPYPDNRPALRSLVRLFAAYQRLQRETEAWQLGEWILTLNPHDNHGLRGLLMNERLQRGDDAGALALADQYPDEIQPEILFGRALALYRLGRQEEAGTALQIAIQRLPKVIDYLYRKQIREPELQPDSIQIGGDDQAWLYRQAMRDTWLQTAGVREWLQRHRKKTR